MAVEVHEQHDAVVLQRIANRVEDILEAARDRESKGQSLALDIDARFRLEDVGAVQFQLASAILEEVGGLGQEEVVSELLSLGLASVLRGAARAADRRGITSSLSEAAGAAPRDDLVANLLTDPQVRRGTRVLN
jgi:hypothetical protein